MKHILLLVFSTSLLFMGVNFAEAQKPKIKEYKKQRAAGDKLLAKHSYIEAKVAYENALKAKPGDGVVKAKLVQVKRAIDKKYKQIVAKGDKELADGNLASAKSFFTDALRYKPNDKYAKSQLDASTLSPGSSFKHTFGGGSYDAAQAIVKVKDGGYLIAGRSTSHGGGNSDMNIIKLDENGKLLWDKTYGENETEEALDIIETSDGGFIIAGHSDSFGAGSDIKDMWIVKIDKDGNKQWAKAYGNNSSIDDARGIVEAHDGGYVIVGTTLPITPDENGDVQSDILVVGIDESGTVKWEKTFGGKSNEEGNDIVKTEDGYAIVGNTETYGKGKWDIWLLHLDKKGEKIWDNTFGGTDNEMGNALTHTKDGGYIIAGYTYSFAQGSHDAWLVKVDSKGTQQWAKPFGGLSTDEAFGIHATKDGGYVAIGYTDVWQSSKADPSVNRSNEELNVFLIKVKESGQVVWERHFGGVKGQRGFDLVENAKGDLVLVGHTNENSQKGVDILVVKVGPSGIITEQ